MKSDIGRKMQLLPLESAKPYRHISPYKYTVPKFIELPEDKIAFKGRRKKNRTEEEMKLIKKQKQIDNEKFQMPAYCNNMSKEAQTKEKISKCYEVIFSYIRNDAQVDIDLAEAMLKKKLLKTDWYDVDLFNKVLKLSAILSDETEREKIRELRLREDPEIWKIVNLIDRAKLARKKTGIWPVNE